MTAAPRTDQIMWHPDLPDGGDCFLFPVVYFWPDLMFLHPNWSNGTVDLSRAEVFNNYAGAVIKTTAIEGEFIGQQRIWKLTGNTHPVCGWFEGAWPD